MIARWHLDLLAVGVLIGAIFTVADAIRVRHLAPSAPVWCRSSRTVPVSPALAVGLAMIAAPIARPVEVVPLGAAAVVAGVLTCRDARTSLLMGALLLVAPGVAGFHLRPQVLALSAIVCAIILADPRGRIVLGTGSGGAVVPFVVCAASWSATPDTELLVLAGGALLVPALRDLLRLSAGLRRPAATPNPSAPEPTIPSGLTPGLVPTSICDAPTLATVVILAAMGFIGRPAGAMVLALIVPVWLLAAPFSVESPERGSSRGSRAVRWVALVVAFVALGVACRTGGLRHSVAAAAPPVVAAGVVSTLAVSAASVARFGGFRTSRVGARRPPR